MTQNEFFNILMDELKDLPECKLYEITCFYQAYFLKYLAYGQSEYEITEKLGNPILIAKKLIDDINMNKPLCLNPQSLPSFNSLTDEKKVSLSDTNNKSDKNRFNINTILKLGIITLLVLFFFPNIVNIGSILIYICNVCIQVILKSLNLGYSENLNFFFHSPILISDFILSLPDNSLISFAIGTIFLSLSLILAIFRLIKFVLTTIKNLLYTLKDKEA